MINHQSSKTRVVLRSLGIHTVPTAIVTLLVIGYAFATLHHTQRYTIHNFTLYTILSMQVPLTTLSACRRTFQLPKPQISAASGTTSLEAPETWLLGGQTTTQNPTDEQVCIALRLEVEIA